MRCWKASRNKAWNEEVVKELLAWRNQCKNYGTLQGLYDDYTPAFEGIGQIAALRVMGAYLPILQKLERLEKSFAAIGRG